MEIPLPARQSDMFPILGLLGDNHLCGDRNFAALAGQRLGYTVVGQCSPGTSVEMLLRQIPGVMDADIVVLSAGTSNLGNAPWSGIEAVGRHYPTILQALGRRRVICVTVPPYQNGHEDHYIRAMNWIIRREAQFAGAEIFDAYEFMKSGDGSVSALRDYRDIVHLSDQGNEYLGSLLAYLIANPIPKLERQAALRTTNTRSGLQCALHDPANLVPLKQNEAAIGGHYHGDFVQAQRCRHCAYVTFPVPPEETLARYYQEEYPKGAASWYNLQTDYDVSKTSVRSRRVIDLAKQFGIEEGAVVHEFGCAFGGTVAALREAGYSATGTELNSSAVEQGRQHGNHYIHSQDTVTFLRGQSNLPSVIYSYHALEHFTDPFSFLDELKDCVAPDGIIVLFVPNSAARFPLVYGHTRYEWFAYPDHLHLFSPGCAAALAERVNCSLLYVGTAEVGLDRENTSRALDQDTESARLLKASDPSMLGEELVVVLAKRGNAVSRRFENNVTYHTAISSMQADVERKAMMLAEAHAASLAG